MWVWMVNITFKKKKITKKMIDCFTKLFSVDLSGYYSTWFPDNQGYFSYFIWICWLCQHRSFHKPVKVSTLCPSKRKYPTVLGFLQFVVLWGYYRWEWVVPLGWLTLFPFCSKWHHWIWFLSTLFALSSVKSQQNRCYNCISLRRCPFD